MNLSLLCVSNIYISHISAARPSLKYGSGFGITVGVHRLWSHRSYSAAFPVRFILMLCNSIANQGESHCVCMLNLGSSPSFSR